jgi:hypothetical protein
MADAKDLDGWRVHGYPHAVFGGPVSAQSPSPGVLRQGEKDQSSQVHRCWHVAQSPAGPDRSAALLSLGQRRARQLRPLVIGGTYWAREQNTDSLRKFSSPRSRRQQLPLNRAEVAYGWKDVVKAECEQPSIQTSRIALSIWGAHEGDMAFVASSKFIRYAFERLAF